MEGLDWLFMCVSVQTEKILDRALTYYKKAGIRPESLQDSSRYLQTLFRIESLDRKGFIIHDDSCIPSQKSNKCCRRDHSSSRRREDEQWYKNVEMRKKLPCQMRSKIEWPQEDLTSMTLLEMPSFDLRPPNLMQDKWQLWGCQLVHTSCRSCYVTCTHVLRWGFIHLISHPFWLLRTNGFSLTHHLYWAGKKFDTFLSWWMTWFSHWFARKIHRNWWTKCTATIFGVISFGLNLYFDWSIAVRLLAIVCTLYNQNLLIQ